jgi:hypothetical protein
MSHGYHTHESINYLTNGAFMTRISFGVEAYNVNAAPDLPLQSTKSISDPVQGPWFESEAFVIKLFRNARKN